MHRQKDIDTYMVVWIIMDIMKKTIFLIVTIILFSSIPVKAGAYSVQTGQKDQKGICLTIYNRNLALVRDMRTITLPKGISILEFQDISAMIKPETAIFKGKGISVLEQNFEFDLLTPESLLKKQVGKTVTLIKTNPETGEEKRINAQVLSAAHGIVLRTDQGIETGIPGRLAFKSVPENLRTSPTLTMEVASSTKGQKKAELAYLTSGLSWKADYVLRLNKNDTAFDLKGWVTLTNRSGAGYRNAHVQLVAGKVNIVPERTYRNELMSMARKAAPVADQSFSEENMFEYHLYSLNRTTTLKNNQTKQVALIQAQNVPCRKEYVISGNTGYRRISTDGSAGKLDAVVYISFDNNEKNRLGMALPAGVVRVYKKDSSNSMQFAGEDRIDHTPDRGTISLKLGSAFDITAEKRHIDYRKLGTSHAPVYQSKYEITVKNAKHEDIEVRFIEKFHGQWQIRQESLEHVKVSAFQAVWIVHVPARGKKTFSYTVQIRGTR